MKKKAILFAAGFGIVIICAGVFLFADYLINKSAGDDSNSVQVTTESKTEEDAGFVGSEMVTEGDAESSENPIAEGTDSMEVMGTETEAEDVDIQAAQRLLKDASYVDLPDVEAISWDENWVNADHSAVHEDSLNLYYAHNDHRKDITVAINPGHGSKSASDAETLCHPDGTPKVTGGTTAEGAITSIASSTGTQLLDGTPEYQLTLELSLKLKDQLLEAGYDVLMLRETADCDMDVIARTVYANNAADCHVAIHYDSTDNDKGLYYTSVPDDETYRAMWPVCDTWEKSHAFGESILAGARENGVKIWESGSMAVDLMQTSYSSVPSVDLEVGDRGSGHSEDTLNKLAKGIASGIDLYFSQQ